MTWYADEIIAVATPEVLQTVRENSTLAPFAYHVTNPLSHRWYTKEIIHELPGEGLLVIRPVCKAELAEWYREPVLNWDCFAEQFRLLPQIDRTRFVQKCRRPPADLAPLALLSCIKT